ncbi:MAG TPA: RNA polymerase sigma factor [Burkholderiales bacterium]|nr:RNA polymerase sigma factor [Burkholderiales bacterium]
MHRDTPDEELMLAYRGGDAAAFDALYARHKGGVFRYLRRQSGNAAIAEELFQDVWMRLIDARARYEPQAKFTTWLYTIAHNRLMDHFRTLKRAALVSYDDADDPPPEPVADTPQPEEMLTRKQDAGRLLAAIDALPAAQREAFVLQQEGDLSVEEIAVATGVNRETAKSRLRYAMAKLRAQLVPAVAANDEMTDR